jgi:hypothetical protein
VGVVEALWHGYLVAGWAADPHVPGTRPLVRLMRDMEVLAEGEASLDREDGQPGFMLAAAEILSPQDFLEGRIRLRVVLPGRNAATTLPMSPQMRAALEAMAADPAAYAAPQGDVPPEPAAPEPATPRPAQAAPDPPRPVPPEPLRQGPVPPEPMAPAPPAASLPKPAPLPLVLPFAPRNKAAPGWQASPLPAGDTPLSPTVAPPAPARPQAAPPQAAPPMAALRVVAPPVVAPPVVAPSAVAPSAVAPTIPPEAPRPLAAMLELARHAAAAGVPALHLLVPRRASMPGGIPAPGLAALEGAAARWPLLAADWVPLRHAFARSANPAALWRQDGHRLSVDGSLAVLETVLAVLRLRRPEALVVLDRAHRLVSRADLAARPRRDVPGEAAGTSFLGVAVPETEPALPVDLFADQSEPRQVGEGLPGLQAWRQAGAPLPWRMVVMAEPGLGGSEGPAQLGWWLRWLAAETVLSEALHLAPPAAVVSAQPDLLLTLACEPEP